MARRGHDTGNIRQCRRVSRRGATAGVQQRHAARHSPRLFFVSQAISQEERWVRHENDSRKKGRNNWPNDTVFFA